MPSKDYFRALELSKEQHRESKTYSGKFLRPYRYRIKEIIDRLECKSVLDYGCGKGLQYEWVSQKLGQTLEEMWGVEVVKYDPAWPRYEVEPSGPFDLVICCHVLNVIPIKDLGWVVDRLYSLSNKAVFIVNGISGPPSKLIKAQWRLDNTPSNWTTNMWISMLQSRKAKDIEVHLVTRSRDPAQMVGRFIL